MRSYLAVLSLLVAAGLASATVGRNVNVSGDAAKASPLNVVSLELSNAQYGDASDTIGADSSNCYGPYALTKSSDGPAYAGFQVYYPASVVASGDSLDLSYQFVGGTTLADTCGTWTALDTTATGGKIGTYVSLASVAARYVVFKIHNCDATQIEIAKPIRVMFKSGYTYNRDR